MGYKDKWRGAEYARNYRKAHAEKLKEIERRRYLKNKEKRNNASREYQKLHPEKVSRYNAKYRTSNPEREKRRHIEYRDKNPERDKNYSASYRAMNVEKIKASATERREKNAEKEKARHKKYRKENPEKIKIKAHNRRAKKKASGGKLSPSLSLMLFAKQRGKCAICKEGLKTGYHMDHIIPLARGGKNIERNIQLTCKRCNGRKSDKDPIQFMQSLGYLL